MADGRVCVSCLHCVELHTPAESATCSRLPPLPAAAVKALRQDQLQFILLSVLSSTIVFNGTPLADLASGWFDASDRPDWITGGTLFWLDDVGAQAVVLGNYPGFKTQDLVRITQESVRKTRELVKQTRDLDRNIRS